MRRFLMLGLLCLPATAMAQEKEVMQLPNAPAGLPFSTAVRVGDILYLSGQIGTVPGAGVVSGGIGVETRQTLENIKSTLDALGSSMERVFKCTVFLKDIADYTSMNEVYARHFGEHRPAKGVRP